MSWPCWLPDSGRLNHKVVTHPAGSLAQDRESSLAETSVLTTMLRRQLPKQSYTLYFDDGPNSSQYANKRAAKHDSDNLGTNEKVLEITQRHFHNIRPTIG